MNGAWLLVLIRAVLMLALPVYVISGVIDRAQAAPQAITIANSYEYFPDPPESQWHYTGTIVEGPLERISNAGFANVSTVKGTKTVDGVAVTVFHDTNPGNHGPTDSFYRRDAAGIVYYGSEPGTELERQIVPYQIVRFPIEVPSSFQQFDRQNLDFGSDLDGDQIHERADAAALVRIQRTEQVAVPAGTFAHALRLEAQMTLRIHLSKSQRTVVGKDTLTAWFARGVGLIKYVERQELPPIRSEHGVVAEITEELESFALGKGPVSGLRGKSSSESIFTDHARRHELSEIVVPARFRADAR